MSYYEFKYRCYRTLMDRKILNEVSRNVALQENKNRLLVWLDAFLSLFIYGTIYTEYQALNFINRTPKNRRTFVTVLWLVQMLDKYNPKEFRNYFHDKRLFNKTFSNLLNREWKSINKENETLESIFEFFLTHNKKIVLKKATGCSGKQVYVSSKEDTAEELWTLINNDGYNLIEESIENEASIKAFNPTSLNTIRIVTVRSNDYFKIICACLRIGAKGSKVDNVSCGGTSARINVATGCLDSVFYANAYRETSNSQTGRNEIGFEIPYWDETINLVSEASKRIPQIHIVGWDVAITPNGPALIEGNESFHTVVMQIYANKDEYGLKALFIEALSHIK